LDHYYARDYDTTTGSWVQPDEWRGLLVRPQSLNRFAYVENSPVAFSDHLGFAAKKAGVKGGLAAGLKKAAVKAHLNTAAVLNVSNGANAPRAIAQSDLGPTPQSRVPRPQNYSPLYTASTHPPCLYSIEACNTQTRFSSSTSPQRGLFSASPWTAEQWQAAGWVIGGAALIGIGIACVIATVGICGAAISVSAGTVAVAGAGSVAAAGAVSISVGAVLGGLAIVGGTAAIHDNTQVMLNGRPSGAGSEAGATRPSSPNQLNQQINRGQAPSGIKRVDTGKVTGEQQHVHLSNGAALNVDGSWKHGFATLTRDQISWLQRNGWAIPHG
jgi:hypothetical protein